MNAPPVTRKQRPLTTAQELVFFAIAFTVALLLQVAVILGIPASIG